MPGDDKDSRERGTTETMSPHDAAIAAVFNEPASLLEREGWDPSAPEACRNVAPASRPGSGVTRKEYEVGTPSGGHGVPTGGLSRGEPPDADEGTLASHGAEAR